MTEPRSSPQAPSPWSVSGDEAAVLMRLYREQLLAYEEIPTEPEDGARAEAQRLREVTLDELPEDVRELAAQYERSRPAVRLTPLRYIAIGGPDGTTIAGAADLPDDGLVSFVVTRTIVDAERAEVASRMLVAHAVVAKQAS